MLQYSTKATKILNARNAPPISPLLPQDLANRFFQMSMCASPLFPDGPVHWQKESRIAGSGWTLPAKVVGRRKLEKQSGETNPARAVVILVVTILVCWLSL